MTDTGERAPDPGDLGDDGWVEALLDAPRRTRVDTEPVDAGPVPSSAPEPTVEAPTGTVTGSDAGWVEALLVGPLPPAPAEVARPTEEPGEQPVEDVVDGPGDVVEVPPNPRPVPSAAPVDLFAAVSMGEPSEEPPPAGEPTVEDGASPADGWDSAPWASEASADAAWQDDGDWGGDPVADDPTADPAKEVPAPLGVTPPPMALPYAEDADQPAAGPAADPVPPGAEPAAAVGASTLVDPGAPGGAARPSSLPFLDLRPADGIPPPTKPKKAGATASPAFRKRALIGGAAALLVVAALAASQVVAERGGDDDGAVLTADPASIEAAEEAGLDKGIDFGVSTSDEVEEGKDEAADAAVSADGTVQGNGPGTAGGGGSGGTSSAGSGGQSTPGGNLRISSDRISMGGGSSGTVTLSNTGGGSLSWNASTSGGGFAASPSSGSLASGQSTTVTATFSGGGPEGTASGSLQISAGGRTNTVALTAEVNRPPAISGISWLSCGSTSKLKAHVEDETGEPVARVEVVGTTPSGSSFRRTAVWYGYGNYRADIGPFSSNGTIRYWVEATDSRGNVARSATMTDSWNGGC